MELRNIVSKLVEVQQHLEQATKENERVDYLTFVPDSEPTLDSPLSETAENYVHWYHYRSRRNDPATTRISGELNLMKWQSVIGHFGLLGFILFFPSAFTAEHEGFTESVIIFNTICAKCHEAQCSGRLSFDESFEKSTSHILRYYGQASGKQWLQKELFDILNYMKERCAYYPMQTHVPLKRVWGGNTLDKFTTLMERNYFIPVGNFSPGRYRIDLQLEKDVKITAHLISEEFEWVFEECFQSSDRQITISFLIDEPGDYYFRMYPRKPVKIIGFAIIPLENGGHLNLESGM